MFSKQIFLRLVFLNWSLSSKKMSTLWIFVDLGWADGQERGTENGSSAGLTFTRIDSGGQKGKSPEWHDIQTILKHILERCLL